MPWDLILELLAHLASSLISTFLVYDERESINFFSVNKNIELDKIRFFIALKLIIKGSIAS